MMVLHAGAENFQPLLVDPPPGSRRKQDSGPGPGGGGPFGAAFFRRVGVLADPAFRGAGGDACPTFEDP